MRMNQVIQERRRALGMTQEQVAEMLGVTAPAVNKWEKGSTCPDVSLLAPLARLLGIDLNELLCFHENLTDEEVQRFVKELMRIIDEDGLEAGFARARELVRGYPNSDFLVYSLATLLQGVLSLSADAEARAEHERQLMEWHVRASESREPRIRNAASLMLAYQSINRKDWDAAQRAIDALPEEPPIDRRTVQARLCSAQEKPDEAALLLEKVVLAAGQELTTALMMLADAEIAAGEMEKAEAVARAYERIAGSLDLWEYMAQAAPLQVAIAKKDVREAVGRLRALLKALDRPWKPFRSPLYHRVSTEENVGTMNERVYGPMLQDLEVNPCYDFLREDAEFRELIAAVRARTEEK